MIVTEAVVPPVDQLYELPPDAVSTVEPDVPQIDKLPVMVAVGNIPVVMILLALEVTPPEDVAVTVYVPTVVTLSVDPVAVVPDGRVQT